METKFTKGKWLIMETDFSPENEITTQERVNDGKSYICGIDTLYSGPHGVEQKANAHLIASAPDMYKVLEGLAELLVELDSHTHPEIELDAVAHSINEVLKEARGESNE